MRLIHWRKKFSLFLLLILVSQFILSPVVLRTARGDIFIDIEDAVDNDTSGVDTFADVGSSSNFTDQQYGPDSFYDTLTEGDTAGSEWLDCNSYDSTWTDWATVGTYPYVDAQDQPTNMFEEMINDGDQVGWFDFPSTSLWGTLNVNVSIYCQNHDGAGQESADVYVDYTGTGSGTYVGTIGQHTDWQYDTIDLGTHTASEVNNLRIYVIGDKVGQPDHVRLDHIRIGVEKTTTYELDLEVQWTSADFDEANEYLCIYGGSMGAEDIGVDVWYGSTWNNVFTDLSAGWNNVSVASYLDGSTFTIRFKGGSETTDTTQNTWQIDTTLLHMWTNIYERDTDESLEGLEASATTSLTRGRLPQQRVDVEAQASREGSFWRYASEEVIISTVASAFKSVTKAVEQTLNILAQATKIRSVSRLASESIIIQTLAESAETFRRTGMEAIGLLTQVVREWSLSRTITQPMEILTSATRQMTAIRATAQPIQILTQAIRQRTVIRLPSLILSIQTMAQAPSSIFRTIQQMLAISTDASRQWSLYRSLSQPLQLFTSVSRQYSATRQTSQLVQLLTQTSGQWTAVRAPNQVLSIQALAQTAETFKKTAQQTLGILVEASRQLTGSRAPAQSLQLFVGASRHWTATRLSTQTLSIQTLTQSTGTFIVNNPGNSAPELKLKAPKDLFQE